EEINRRMGFPLVVRYAMTESPTICGTEPQDPPDVQFQTVGRPQLGMEVSVAAPAGAVGQVRIRGECVMRGYWNAPELTRATFDDEGWLVSGDLGYLRADGNLAIVGRATDMYIRGGYNVYPGEVEAVLALHPAIASVSVVGTPAPRIGEIGVPSSSRRRAARHPALKSCGSWCAPSLPTTRHRTGWRSSASYRSTRCSRWTRTPCASWPADPGLRRDPRGHDTT
ncbi:MAG TPA: AMP-binding protein, partial [Trebonia sp.]